MHAKAHATLPVWGRDVNEVRMYIHAFMNVSIFRSVETSNHLCMFP